jgi:DNA-directed RNA polymerase subunit RPC12/RpoP
MSDVTYRCDGCGTELTSVEDLSKVQGTVSRSWRCRVCHTTVPGVVAERIQHQR